MTHRSVGTIGTFANIIGKTQLKLNKEPGVQVSEPPQYCGGKHKDVEECRNTSSKKRK